MHDAIQSLADAAGKAAHAECVYVFGSQARGEAQQESDVDLALIIPDQASPREALRAAIKATSRRVLPLDLVIIAHSTWAEGRSLLARQVRKEGVLLYGG
jgi:predicted nucleotidyltransferase